MQSQRIQKQRRDHTKQNHSASKIAKIKTPSERNAVNLFRFPVRSGATPSDIYLTPQNIQFLQRTIGNQAVGHIIQAKLKIGQPGDKYEQEADLVAEEVMSMSDPEVRPKPTLTAGGSSYWDEEMGDQPVQSMPLAGKIAPLVQKQAELEEEETVQPKQNLPCQPSLQKQEEQEEKVEEQEESFQTNSFTGEVSPALNRQTEAEKEETESNLQAKELSSKRPTATRDLESRFNSQRGGGEPLSESTRGFLEPRFGADFSQVRVHTGSGTAATAKSINAKAFTVGKNISFGKGQYTPETQTGRRLLAHELAHVLQQEDRVAPRLQLSRLQEFNNAKPEHDPSKLYDSDIEATNEFKAYTNPKLIWQWKLKVTREEAILACQLILRHMRAGNAFNWKKQARSFVIKARKQLGTLKETEKLVGKLEWVGSGPSEFKSPKTATGDFAKWILGGGPEPTNTGKMNCWEMILFGGFQGGFVSKSWIESVYKEAAKKSGMAIPAEIEKKLCSGSVQTFDPADPKSPEPLPGDIVIFNAIANHAAISLGTKNKAGEHELISHWEPPHHSKSVEKTTIEALLPHTSVSKAKFCAAPW